MLSDTGFFENTRNYLRMYELKSANTRPISSELKPSVKKFAIILKGVLTSMTDVLAVYFITVLNRMIETASLMMPSPNTILNKLGYLS